MLRLRVLEILKDQNHTKYWLYKQMDMSYQNFSRIVNNETTSIRYENLEKLSRILNFMAVQRRSFQASCLSRCLVLMLSALFLRLRIGKFISRLVRPAQLVKAKNPQHSRRWV